MNTWAWTLIGMALGGLLTFLITLWRDHRAESKINNRLFAALNDELMMNIAIIISTLEAMEENLRGIKKAWARTYSPLRNSAYENLFISGKLGILGENLDLLFKLTTTYERISRYNDDGEEKIKHKDLLEKLTRDIEELAVNDELYKLTGRQVKKVKLKNLKGRS